MRGKNWNDFSQIILTVIKTIYVPFPIAREIKNITILPALILTDLLIKWTEQIMQEVKNYFPESW
jgi:hypothetical protein